MRLALKNMIWCHNVYSGSQSNLKPPENTLKWLLWKKTSCKQKWLTAYKPLLCLNMTLLTYLYSDSLVHSLLYLTEVPKDAQINCKKGGFTVWALNAHRFSATTQYKYFVSSVSYAVFGWKTKSEWCTLQTWTHVSKLIWLE